MRPAAAREGELSLRLNAALRELGALRVEVADLRAAARAARRDEPPSPPAPPVDDGHARRIRALQYELLVVQRAHAHDVASLAREVQDAKAALAASTEAARDALDAAARQRHDVAARVESAAELIIALDACLPASGRSPAATRLLAAVAGGVSGVHAALAAHAQQQSALARPDAAAGAASTPHCDALLRAGLAGASGLLSRPGGGESPQRQRDPGSPRLTVRDESLLRPSPGRATGVGTVEGGSGSGISGGGPLSFAASLAATSSTLRPPVSSPTVMATLTSSLGDLTRQNAALGARVATLEAALARVAAGRGGGGHEGPGGGGGGSAVVGAVGSSWDGAGVPEGDGPAAAAFTATAGGSRVAAVAATATAAASSAGEPSGSAGSRVGALEAALAAAQTRAALAEEARAAERATSAQLAHALQQAHARLDEQDGASDARAGALSRELAACRSQLEVARAAAAPTGAAHRSAAGAAAAAASASHPAATSPLHVDAAAVSQPQLLLQRLQQRPLQQPSAHAPTVAPIPAPPLSARSSRRWSVGSAHSLSGGLHADDAEEYLVPRAVEQQLPPLQQQHQRALRASPFVSRALGKAAAAGGALSAAASGTTTAGRGSGVREPLPPPLPSAMASSPHFAALTRAPPVPAAGTAAPPQASGSRHDVPLVHGLPRVAHPLVRGGGGGAGSSAPASDPRWVGSATTPMSDASGSGGSSVAFGAGGGTTDGGSSGVDDDGGLSDSRHERPPPAAAAAAAASVSSHSHSGHHVIHHHPHLEADFAADLASLEAEIQGMTSSLAKAARALGQHAQQQQQQQPQHAQQVRRPQRGGHEPPPAPIDWLASEPEPEPAAATVVSHSPVRRLGDDDVGERLTAASLSASRLLLASAAGTLGLQS